MTEATKSTGISHQNALFDAVALLDAAAERLDAATPSASDDPDAAETMHNTLRIVQMAWKKVKDVAEELASHG